MTRMEKFCTLFATAIFFLILQGVYILGPDSTGACVELGSIELAGPIVQLMPLFDGSADFVSEAGLIGIIERNQPVVALEQ